MLTVKIFEQPVPPSNGLRYWVFAAVSTVVSQEMSGVSTFMLVFTGDEKSVNPTWPL